jgi:hypothetical protein
MTFATKGAPHGHGVAPLELSSYGGVDLQEIQQKRPEAQARNARMRRQRLVLHLHRLGPKPLFHFLNEVERGADLWPHLERYAALPPDFIKAHGGDQFELFLHVVDGGKP